MLYIIEKVDKSHTFVYFYSLFWLVSSNYYDKKGVKSFFFLIVFTYFCGINNGFIYLR